jgi:hypothetical protein
MKLVRVVEVVGAAVRAVAVVVRAEADVVQPAEDAAAHVSR